jgi:phosphoribosylformylglycinamidine synthase
MIYRVEVFGKDGGDGESVRKIAREAGVVADAVESRRVFFIESSDSTEAVRSRALPLLADEIVEQGELLTAADLQHRQPHPGTLEIHLKPGVMDPVAASTEVALRQAGLHVSAVRTGRSYRFSPPPPPDALTRVGSRVLGNSVIEAVHLQPFLPEQFPTPRAATFELRRVPVRDLTDAQLQDLSRNGHLFLNLVEMKAIQQYFQSQKRDPTDIELETLAQTWSEHCVHKTLKSAVEVQSPDGTRKYGNLIKETIFASTQQLIAGGKADFCLSVFKDNAGVIALDETDAVCFKVETHNRPSAIDPYGGAATGAGGCIRDVLGTGLGARPIANTDIFCVAHPAHWRQDADGSSDHARALPPGVLHPKRTLTQVVAGVRDYGNRMGIPTVNGAVYFDDRYVANPLVFCGCLGLIPRSRIEKQAKSGDAIVVIGGRTGRDGIHGATFSSAELTSTHADEFSHAVQIGNAITQKSMMDVVLQAAKAKLFSAITDCGAGGLSSACGEMGEKLGAEVHLDRVPLKYAGLRYDEIWISEAQERMVLAVPQDKVEALLKLASSEDVEATVIGHFGTPGRELRLLYQGTEVGKMAMDFVHDGIPMPTRRAVVRPAGSASESWWKPLLTAGETHASLLRLLQHPNIASKHFIVRQYDHEVQGMSVVKPFVGSKQRGPSDAAVLRPKPQSRKAVAVGCGMCPWIGDAYEMALASIDEAVRNVVAVGGDPDRTAILDNFCWPGTDNEQAMGDLVRTAEACRDAALAYRIPFISGKDSLHNQYTDKSTGAVTRIPNTLLVSAVSIVEDLSTCITMDLKSTASHLLVVGPLAAKSTLAERIAVHRLVHRLIVGKKLHACHDVSDGGWLVAVAEMAIGSRLGVKLGTTEHAFTECVASYVIEVDPRDVASVRSAAAAEKIGVLDVGQVVNGQTLTYPDGTSVPVAELTAAWMAPLDW